MRRTLAEDSKLAYLVADLFLREGLSAAKIADAVNELLVPSPNITREMVYPLLAKARSLSLVRLVPPSDEVLRQEIVAAFDFDHTDQYVRVVPTPGSRFNYLVSQAAAARVVEIISQLGRRSSTPIGIGLGPGRASLDLCEHLGQLMVEEPRMPRVQLHAIGAGAPFDQPEYSSTSFFNLLPKQVVAKRFGLFCETLSRADDFVELALRPDFQQAYQLRAQISLVCTSMGDLADEHDIFRTFLMRSNVDVNDLRRRGWIGSVQYRPYDVDGPIIEKGKAWRAVTLFELDDFVRLSAMKGKHVLLVARQCGLCGRTRAAALLPLMRNPKLRVFSDIVMDSATAQELLSISGA